MIGREIFKMWSPIGAKWIDWIRPVPFVSIHDAHKQYSATNFIMPDINYIHTLQENIAIILDLPGHASIEEGLALSKLGYRPIPIYNGTQAQDNAMALVDNHIESALVWGAYELQKVNIDKEAPPVFLIDSNRMHRFKMDVSIFDNSWDVYAQDIPSANYFLKNGIEKIIIRGNIVHKDIAKIVFKFQQKGITILFTNGYEEPKKVTIKSPSRKPK
ncbi:MAG: hypothetical protein ACK5LC_12450 [Coprobacillaceae bacterium]